MRKLLLPALTAATLVGSFAVPGSAAQPEARPGVITSASVRSATLGEDINYNVYLPAGYGDSTQRYPVLYLLHGRGDTMAAWTQMKSRLDELIGSGEIPPTIAVMPDAPWSSRGSYYVDSAYTGADRGRPVETAFFRDFVPHVDASYRTIADRNGRAVAGYSMGGAGALRYAMAHPEVFGASIALSPAVYFPLPPADSSAREFGAFGKGKDPFSEAVYLRSNYPAAFKSFAAKGLPSHLYLAVGDDEWKNPKPVDYTHDLDFEAHIVFNQAVRVPNLTSEFRVVDGGHDWDVWGPTFADGAKYIFQYIGKPPAVPMKATVTGTASEDRAGGIATDASGNVYQAAAVEGSVDGTPYAGGKDVTLTKYAPAGTREWTRSIGTSGTERVYGVAVDSQGRVVVTGYTTGDLDGAHAGNTTDDAFAVQYDAAGNQRWTRQFGVPGVADRSYSVAVDGDAIYLGGYTKGSLDGPNAGDKDVFLTRLDGDGQQVWLRQVGSAGEEKGMAVAVSGGSVYLAGMTGGAMGTSTGGIDGFVTRYSVDGDAVWLKQFGTSASDEAWGLAADPNGGVYLTGYTAGDFSGALAGDKDIIVARVDGDGVLTWRDQFGTTGNDKGAAVAVDRSGNVYVAGFTDGAVETSIGKFDGVLAKYSPELTRTWTRQFGTAEDDAADPFAEANVYLTTTPDGTQVSGLTATDVFRTAFGADGGNESP